MDAFEKIDKKALREFLSKSWMTHDAMWFFHCLTECGIEKTVKINTAAVDSMSQIEIERITKILGYGNDKITNFKQLANIMEGAMDLVKADFMKFQWNIKENDKVLEWEWKKNECFAYEGIKKLGVIDDYTCGIMTRIKGWLTGLGINYKITPEINGCLMHRNGNCTGQFIIDL